MLNRRPVRRKVAILSERGVKKLCSKVFPVRRNVAVLSEKGVKKSCPHSFTVQENYEF